MIPVADALSRLLALVPPPQHETISLMSGHGRVLLSDAVASRPQPPFDASAMDGYAVRGTPAPGQRFRVIGTSQAGGAFAGTIGPGEAVRIFTGAPVPAGATNVVIQEDVAVDGPEITLLDSLGTGPHIRAKALDFDTGFTLRAPRRLRPGDLALLAAMNCARLEVARRPEIAVIATGDELVLPGRNPGPDQIIASNLYAIKAMAEAEGACVRLLPIARDQREALSDVLDLAAGADVIVTIGGASVGDHDLVARVITERGMELAFHKVAMRPGKPVMAGRMGDAILLGLPGNPVSAIVCAELFLLPLVRALQGLPEPAPKSRQAVLAEDIPANGIRAHYQRARLLPGTALPGISPVFDQDSSLLVPFTEANALLIRPVNDPARKAGEIMDYLPI